MEGGAAAATIEVLVQNLINVSKEEISLIQGLEKDAGQLTTTLAMIQSYLKDAEKKFIFEEAVKTWLKELEAVAFDADNVLDTLNYHLLHKKIKTMKAMKDKVLSCFSSFNHIARPRKMAHTIKQINMDFKSINNKATELGLQSRLEAAPAARHAALETDSFTVDPIFIGRDDDMSNIVEMLMTSIATDEHVFSILPVVGMGGLGKTTLARKVFNHEKVKARFVERIWVHVSKNFDPVILFKRINAVLNLRNEDSGSREGYLEENGEVGSREVILKKVQDALKGKNYLLVLDDIWNQDLQKWEDFMNSLSGVTSIKGNGIIVTTRNTEVASIVKPLHIHHLNGLSDEDCWSIIKAKSFGKEDVSSEFETIGRKIARRCQGLPLAANVIGGVLRSKPKEEWHLIKENWLSDVEGDENNISKILKLSFDDLPLPSHKKCFVYCSIFPKGTQISKKKLIELWMAEGFLLAGQTIEMETLGKRYLKLLLQNSLLLVVKRDDYDRETHFCMHDLVHDLACSVSAGIFRDRYISCEHDGDDESFPIPKGKARNLRTLFFTDEISHIKFSDFKSLHTLTLYYVEELPSSIKELIHLRYLNISKTSIRYLPDSIGELYHLQTLRARQLWKLPITSKYLISLRHLHIGSETELAPEIGRLTSLQTLSYFKVCNKKGHRIEELGSLKNLKGKLEIQNLENVRDKDEAKKANLFQNPNLFKLVLWWGESREGEINDENVLEGLQPHPNLKYLDIFGFNGKHFPLWTLKMAVRDEVEGCWIVLNYLMEIKLSSCNKCTEIPMLGHLPHLKSLYLVSLSNVRSISGSFYGIDIFSSSSGACKEETQTIIVFPALERLVFSEMSNLTHWEEVEFPSEVKVFPRLEYLEISQCNQLMVAPTHFPCLKELHIQEMDSHIPLANICGVRLMSLRKLNIAALDGLKFLPHWIFHNNQNLSELDIDYCPNLRELPHGLHTLDSLESLRIQHCQNLKSIAYQSQGGLASLRSLEISDCRELINLPHELVECAPLLGWLSLEGLSNLKNLPHLIECLQKSPSLRVLKIEDVPILAISCNGNSSFCSLQELDMDVSMESIGGSSAVVKETVDGILQACCRSLRKLDLTGMETWESLPGSIQHLTALCSLYLSNFRIQELPEWFGNLTSLRTLFLNNCQNLRHLPSVEAIRRLTNFKELMIVYCPLLHIEPQQTDGDGDDSEWPKISHLADVYIDGQYLIRSYSRVKNHLSLNCNCI